MSDTARMWSDIQKLHELQSKIEPLRNLQQWKFAKFSTIFSQVAFVWLCCFFSIFYSRSWGRLGLLCPLSGGHPFLRRCWHPFRRFGSFWWPRGVYCKNQGQVLSKYLLGFLSAHFSQVWWFLLCDWELWLCSQLFELGPDGGDHETDGDLLAETDVLAYDCAAR